MKTIELLCEEPNSQGSVERANQDVENIVAVWKRDNNRSDWAAAFCSFFRYQMSL